MTISEKGVFLDAKTGKVVDGPVEEGQQLVAPGGEITPAVQQNIDLAREVEAGGSAPKTITSESLEADKPKAKK